MTLVKPPAEPVSWYSTSAEAAAARLGVSMEHGLDAAEVTRRLAEYGPNQLATEPPPSLWAVALGQLSNPMNIMLVIVGVASLAIGQVATGIFVVLAGDVQRRDGLEPGAEGASERGRAGPAPGSSRPGAASRRVSRRSSRSNLVPG